MTIKDKRNAIDMLDDEIVDLLIKRSMTAREISLLKLSAGLPIADISRESEVIDRAKKNARGVISDAVIEEIYKVILAESRRVQRAVQSEVSREGAIR